MSCLEILSLLTLHSMLTTYPSNAVGQTSGSMQTKWPSIFSGRLTSKFTNSCDLHFSEEGWRNQLVSEAHGGAKLHQELGNVWPAYEIEAFFVKPRFICHPLPHCVVNLHDPQQGWGYVLACLPISSESLMVEADQDIPINPEELLHLLHTEVAPLSLSSL